MIINGVTYKITLGNLAKIEDKFGNFNKLNEELQTAPMKTLIQCLECVGIPNDEIDKITDISSVLKSLTSEIVAVIGGDSSGVPLQSEESGQN